MVGRFYLINLILIFISSSLVLFVKNKGMGDFYLMDKTH